MIQTLIRVYHSTFIIITFKLIRREIVHGSDFASLESYTFVIQALLWGEHGHNF